MWVSYVSDGGFIATGRTYSCPGVSNGAFVMKVTSDGTLEWKKCTVDTGGYNTYYSVIEDKNDPLNFFLAGGIYFGSQYEMFVSKLNSEGSPVWQKKVTHGVNNYRGFAKRAIQTEEGDIVFCGYRRGEIGSYSMYVGKLDAETGNQIWLRYFPDSIDHYCWSIIELDDGDFFVGGKKDHSRISSDGLGSCGWQNSPLNFEDSGATISDLNPGWGFKSELSWTSQAANFNVTPFEGEFAVDEYCNVFDETKCGVTTCYDVWNNSTENGCGTHGECVGYDTCDCVKDWYGAHCNITTCSGKYTNDSDVCNGRGECYDHEVCQCDSVNYHDTVKPFWFKRLDGSNVDIQSVGKLPNGDYYTVGHEWMDSTYYEVVVHQLDRQGDFVATSPSYALGTTGQDYGYASVVSEDGGFVIAGSTSFYSYNEQVSLTKFRNGSFDWKIYIGDTEDYQIASSIATTPDGYIIGGKLDYEMGMGMYYALLIKFDSNGSRVWAKDYGEDWRTTVINSVCYSSDGGFIVVGETDSCEDVYNGAFVMKVFSNGTIWWAKCIHHGGSGKAYSVIEDKNDPLNYVIVGNLYSGTDYETFVAKLDSSGSPVWTKIIPSERHSDGYGRSVIQTEEGDIVFCGYRRYYGVYSMFVGKLDSTSGNQFFLSYIDDPTNTYCYSVAEMEDGTFFVGGKTDYSRLSSNGDGCNWKDNGNGVEDFVATISDLKAEFGEIDDFSWTSQDLSYHIDIVVPSVSSRCYEESSVSFCDVTTCNGVSSSNSSVCSTHGDCVEYNECDCDEHYDGTECDIWFCFGTNKDDLENVCSAYGRCQSNDVCDCYDGYYGETCNITTCYDVYSNEPEACYDQGDCNEEDICECYEHYYGLLCNITHCNGYFSNETLSCGVHGVCLEHEYCDCEENWYGQDVCDITVCDGYFSNETLSCGVHGTCIEPEYCDCEENWYGQDVCNITVCNGYFSNETLSCGVHGACLEHEYCDCEENWYGQDVCDITVCNGHFSNETESCGTRGSCLAPEYCDCDLNWYGEDICNITMCYGFFSNETESCSSHGTCSEYNSCDCESNYYGKSCFFTTCGGISSNQSSVCSSHGYCDEFDVCVCDEHYLNENCSVTTCNSVESDDPSVCSSRGDCVDYNDCDCQTNYTGDQCQLTTCYTVSNIDSGVCSSHGECVGYDDCDCKTNYTGVQCQLTNCYDVSSVDSGVCSSHGECVEYNNCDCFSNYTGTECGDWDCHGTNKDDGSVCSTHGECVDYNDCVCEDHYDGPECDDWDCYNIDKNDPKVCNYLNGTCTSYDLCDCNDGYFDDECNNWDCYLYNKNDSEVCNFRKGICVSHDRCICSTGYFGDGCDDWDCHGTNKDDGSVCSTHGECVDYNDCDCEDQYDGPECDIWYCDGTEEGEETVCSSHGDCISHDKCVCDEHYNGTECDNWDCHSVNKNDAQVCSSRGDCVGYDNCTCEANYYGDSCFFTTCGSSTSNDSTVCSSRGYCDGFDICVCNEQYFGYQCELTSCYGVPSNSSDICNTHGECDEYDECVCDPNYFNLNCSVTECNSVLSNVSSVCSSRGDCVDYNDCDCFPDYTGSNCQLTTCYGFSNINSFVCSTHGECVEYNNCDCFSNYNGTICNVWSCHGTDSEEGSVCSTHGECVDYNDCVCEDHYDGPECDIWYCDGTEEGEGTVCSSHGDCISHDKCVCDEHYNGTECDNWDCHSVNKNDAQVCSSRGDCVGYDNCDCEANYNGSKCELTTCYGVTSNSYEVCGTHGICYDFDQCSCEPDFNQYARDCSVTICYGILSNYTNSVCYGNGDCGGINQCDCYNESGYTGQQCIQRIGSVEIEVYDVSGSNATNGTNITGIITSEYEAPWDLIVNKSLDGRFDCSIIFDYAEQFGNCPNPDGCCYFLGEESRRSIDTPTASTVLITELFPGHEVSKETTLAVLPVSIVGTEEVDSSDFVLRKVCEPNYYGFDCSITTCFGIENTQNEVCTGFGSCEIYNHCDCDEHYDGEECDIWYCFGVMMNSTVGACQNGGTCTSHDTCTCEEGYEGSLCEIPICDPACGNHGTCTSPDTCTCEEGYEGSLCEIPICDPTCGNHGTCTSPDTCTCEEGYEGSLCEIPICDPACGDNGTCTSPDACTCEEGYEGSLCETPICDPTCGYHGTCTSPDTCTCYEHYTGDECEKPIYYKVLSFFGSLGNNEAFSLHGTDDGGNVISGYAEVASKRYGVLLAKFRYDGSLEWGSVQSGILSGSNDSLVGNSVHTTSDGGFIVSGTATISKTVKSLLLSKFNSFGGLDWSFSYSGTVENLGNIEYAKSIQETTDGGFIVAGHTNTSSLLAKFGVDGSSEWFCQIWSGTARSVIETTDGGFLVTGHSLRSSLEVLVAKFLADGTFEFGFSFGISTITDDCGKSVHETSDGGFIITGHSSDFSGRSEMFLSKFSSSGSLEWSYALGGDHDFEGRSVQETSDGGYIVTGNTDSGSIEFGFFDILLAKFDSGGNSEWVTRTGGEFHSYGESVRVTSDGGYIVAGHMATHTTGEYKDSVLLKFNPSGKLEWTSSFGSINGSGEFGCGANVSVDSFSTIFVEVETNTLSFIITAIPESYISTIENLVSDFHDHPASNIIAASCIEKSSCNGCNTHGTCDEEIQECDCDENYSGENCQITTCRGILSYDEFNVCSGGGDCLSYDVCTCDEYWFGWNCNTTTCHGVFSNESQVCNGTGECVDYGVCKCPHNGSYYFAFDCEEKCFGEYVWETDFVCSGRGKCLGNDTCVCNKMGLDNDDDDDDDDSDDDDDHDGKGPKHKHKYKKKKKKKKKDKKHDNDDDDDDDNDSAFEIYFGEECQLTKCYDIFSDRYGDVCSGNGICVDYNTCACDEGFFGEECEMTR